MPNCFCQSTKAFLQWSNVKRQLVLSFRQSGKIGSNFVFLPAGTGCPEGRRGCLEDKWGCPEDKRDCPEVWRP